MESPEIDPHKYSQLILIKEQRQSFSTNGIGTAGNPHAKK